MLAGAIDRQFSGALINYIADEYLNTALEVL